MSENREKAIKLLDPIAEKEVVKNYLYVVTKQVGKNGYVEELSNEFCEDCIKDAVLDQKREWFNERQKKLGIYYTALNTGIYHIITPKGRIKVSKPSKTDLDNYKKGINKEYKLNTKFEYQCHHADYETNGFRFCESCGVRFNTSLLLDNQELEHWESQNDEHFKDLSSNQASELREILEAWHDDKFDERLEILALRILNNFTQASPTSQAE